MSNRFLLIAILYVTALMTANTVSSKLVELGPFIVAGGIVVFPVSYIFGDILTEVYGYKASRKIIWLGFLAQLLMVFFYLVVSRLPAPTFWTNQNAYDAILGFVPRLVFASMFAYLCGEFANSYVLSRMKVWMNGRALWMRTIGSTLVGEGIDSVIFGLIAFGGVLPFPALQTVILSGYILKVIYEILATPITYKIVRWLKTSEATDVYDRNIRYSPFARE